MKNILIGAAIVLALLTTAHADTFRYRCMFHGKKYPLQVDDTSMFLLWRGRQFGLNTVKDPDVCGKGGWHAEGTGRPSFSAMRRRGRRDFGRGGE